MGNGWEKGRRSLLATLLVWVWTGQAWAANGGNVIAVSPSALGVGGATVSRFFSVSDSLHRNPSLLGLSGAEPGSFLADASFLLCKNNASADAGLGLKSSSAGPVPATNISLARVLDERWTVGIGLVSAAGTLNNQKDQVKLAQLAVRSLVVRVLPSVAFRPVPVLSLGASLVVAAGVLTIDDGLSGSQSARPPHGDLGVGAQFGFTIAPSERFHFGVAYQTQVRVDYPNVIDLDQFGPAPSPPADDVRTEQPAELAAGVSLSAGTWVFLVDYRWIDWSTSLGFRDLGWQDQHVIALGVEKGFGPWKVRAGMNYGQSPIRDASGESGLATIDGHQMGQSTISLLNLVAFPALASLHLTLGAAWEISPSVTVELAGMYAPGKTATRSGTDLTTTAYTYRAEVSQWSLGAGAKFLF